MGGQDQEILGSFLVAEQHKQRYLVVPPECRHETNILNHGGQGVCKVDLPLWGNGKQKFHQSSKKPARIYWDMTIGSEKDTQITTQNE